MKRFNILGLFILLVFLVCITNNCKKDKPSPSGTTTESPQVKLEINQFIWSDLNYFYLWTDSVPKLSTAYFNDNENTWNTFLNGYSDHSKLFYDLLYQYNVVDKWSWIVSDYTVLENELKGIDSTMGFQFGLNYVDATKTNVVGYVTYVLKGSPADLASIKRGNLFTKIDDQQLTVSNYISLLTKTSFKISFATYNSANNTLTSNGVSTTLTGIQFQENPILFDTVYNNVNGKNVGYLVYNGFYPGYDNQLNDVFSTFKSANIQTLILDLRYNGGGAVQSAIYLASMIYGTNPDQIFLQTQSNQNNIDDTYLNGTYGFIDTIERITPTSNPTPINTANISQLYVLTQKNNTASASELIINGLRPYIPVTLFGSGTVGKYVGSVTLKDYISEGVVNPNDKWAMQPIVIRSANANGESYYKNGFAPKDSVFENYKNIMPLGNPAEPFLNAALNDIKGIPQSSALKSAGMRIRTIGTSKDYVPHAKEMYIPGKGFNHDHTMKFKK